jgi:site-specific DNA-methyltransferase (adenine-specific)
MSYQIFLDHCVEWAKKQPENSIHAIVTDPPFGRKEYTKAEQRKLRAGRGGIWRIPPSFDGSKRRPLPRFTVLSDKDIEEMYEFFLEWGKRMQWILVPGGHVMIAANPLLSQHVWLALLETGLEKRGELVRIVRTFRGGDRPKGAHEEFSDVCTMPRANWEPWGLFRKPLDGLVADNLRKWKTGALRRLSEDTPFLDVLKSGRTSEEEREIAAHPSLKPQHFMRQLVWASLPLGEGVVLDPFMGSGATIAAAEAIGYDSIGVEIDPQYFEMARTSIPKLAAIKVTLDKSDLNSKNEVEPNHKLNSQTGYNLPLFKFDELDESDYSP